jgi:DNA polymerase/3'-5' exonuclease PolX
MIKIKIKIKPKEDLLDLRLDAGLTISDIGQTKKEIISMLDALIEHTTALKAGANQKDRVAYGHKISSFTKGRDAIRGFEGEIKSGAQARKDIPGVGEGIAKRIDEFLETGKLAELELQCNSTTGNAKIIMDLTGVTGIGEVKARNLVEEFGVTSVQDLIDKYHSGRIRIEKNQLTHHIAVGLEFYRDLQLRMPWSEADQIAKRIRDLVPARLTVTVCGSYRRKKETCGDIDVLISDPVSSGAFTLSTVVETLHKSGLLVGHLTSHGDTKYMGVCRARQDLPGRRIDIRFVPHNSLGAAILYFTGSGKFNKIMRFRANQRGYTLNEYGLFHIDDGKDGCKGAQIATPTEEDVFKILRFLYLTPEQRDF